MSKIQAFIDGFNSNSLIKLNSEIERQNRYKSARSIAINISVTRKSSWPFVKGSDGVYVKDPKINTIGDLFRHVYPDVDGGVQVLPNINIDGVESLSALKDLSDKDSGADVQYEIIKKTWNAIQTIKQVKVLRDFGAQKWFDNFMSSAQSYTKLKNTKISDYSSFDKFEDDFDELGSLFRKNYDSFFINGYFTTLEVLHEAFIDAGDNYKSNIQPDIQSSGTQSGTQSNVNSGYRVTVKNPKSNSDRSIIGSITFSEIGSKLSSSAKLNGLPNPWTNPKNNTVVSPNNGSIEYQGPTLDITPDTRIKMADSAISFLQNLIQYKYGITLELEYKNDIDSVNDIPSTPPTPINTQTTAPTPSNFDASGIKVTIVKKSGPGEIIGITDRVIQNGFISFDGIQFDTPGDYVLNIVTNSNLVETKEISIKVSNEDDIIPQEQSRGEDKKIDGTRPIIAQIDKPTLKLNPIEFPSSSDNIHSNETMTGLGFVPFFWYNGYQITPSDIKSLKLYYDGFIPNVVINFVDSLGFIKRDGFPLDDTKFEIFLNSGTKNLKSIHMKFKLIDFQENKGKSYTVTGSIDLEDFYKINYNSYKGTSFEVLRKVTSELQLGFNSNITNTNDNMTWVNNGKVFKEFVSNIIRHSYISDTSYVLGYIDYYYCFNYVDIEKEWTRDISKDVGLSSTGINHLNGDIKKDKIERLQLTNDPSTNFSPFYFSRYKLSNNSTKISVNKGYYTTSKAYDSISKQFLVFDVDSQNADESKNITLKGAPNDGKLMQENYRTKYSGKMDTENVHKNYYYSETQNQVNLDNMVRISVELELPNANFNLYKFMKIQLNFINQKGTPTNDELSQERLTGEWVIVDIGYNWTGGKLTQQVKCVRKELSKTNEEIENSSKNPSTKPEVNTENNINPVPQDVVLPTPPNSIYKVGEVYNVRSNDGKVYTLTITKILEDGKNVSAIIK